MSAKHSPVRIRSTATGLPPVRITKEQARDYAARFFADMPSLERLLGVFDHAGIDTRYICESPQWFESPKSFREKNEAYLHWATELAADVAVDCLKRAEVPAEAVDTVVFVSSTGMATPTIEARIMERVGFSPHVRRMPLWGLGCAAGAMGLSAAERLLRGSENGRALLISVELCSLTFQFHDRSKSNLISLALFGDGAAAVLLESGGDTGPEIVDTRSTTWPDELDAMGWSILDEGLQVVFSRRIPGIARREAEADIGGFLAPHGLRTADLDHWIVHPGGMKVLEAYEEALALQPTALELPADVMRRHGNMSSATVLFVLHELLNRGAVRSGDSGLVHALGPGFSSENLLLRG